MDAERYAQQGLHRVEGWFSTTDARLFRVIDEVQRSAGITGDLLEIGVYKGRSALLLGYLRRDEEQVVLCDPFDTADALVDPLHDRFYGGAGAQALLARWRSFHARPPQLLVGLSTDVGAEIGDGGTRFVHIDGGHEYADVVHDVDLARRVSLPGAVVAVDDWRSAHTPGVGAAVWQRVFAGVLQPVAVTNAKLYATTDPEIRRALQTALRGDDALVVEEHHIDDQLVLVVQPGRLLRRQAPRRIPWVVWRRLKAASRRPSSS